MFENRLTLMAILAAASLALQGCGSSSPPSSSSNTGNSGSSGGTSISSRSRNTSDSSRSARRQRRVPPPAARGSRRGERQPPNLGGGTGSSATPPPRVAVTPPSSGNDTQFDAETRALMDQYNLVIKGKDASGANLEIVKKAARLYQPRRHTLTVVVQKDSSKLPVGGVWYTLGGRSATTELYQPQIAHVANHEFAHDLTLLVNRSAGNRLGDTIQANSNDPSVFPSSYSRSQIPEAMAESLSFWAEKVSNRNRPSSYNPPDVVVADLQPFLADGLRTR